MAAALAKLPAKCLRASPRCDGLGCVGVCLRVQGPRCLPQNTRALSSGECGEPQASSAEGPRTFPPACGALRWGEGCRGSCLGRQPQPGSTAGSAPRGGCRPQERNPGQPRNERTQALGRPHTHPLGVPTPDHQTAQTQEPLLWPL